MIRLVIANQKGGVAKTTTTLALAREFAERGLKILLIDIDSQGSIGASLGLKPQNYLYSLLISNFRFKDCIVSAHPNISCDVSARRRRAPGGHALGARRRDPARPATEGHPR